jgi:hypothetical protein
MEIYYILKKKLKLFQKDIFFYPEYNGRPVENILNGFNVNL